MMLGLIQIGFAMAAGSVLFHMQWGSSLPMVALVLVGWAAFAAGLAIVLANVTRTPAQTAGIGVFATQILAALGGCWWPIEVTPAWMQKLAIALPTGWAMDAMHKLVNFGDPAASPVMWDEDEDEEEDDEDDEDEEFFDDESEFEEEGEDDEGGDDEADLDDDEEDDEDEDETD